MRKFIMSLTTVASISLAAIPVLGLTQAANAGELEARIAVSDLNLSNPAQAAVFKARVDRAAQSLCRAQVRNNTARLSYGACIVSVRHEASNQLSKTQRQALKFAARATSVEMAAR